MPFEPPACQLVLVVRIKDPLYWESQKETIIQQIGLQPDAAFAEMDMAVKKVYWIGIIGPRWIYGEKDDGQDVKPLIDWHDIVVDDEYSYSELIKVAELVTHL